MVGGRTREERKGETEGLGSDEPALRQHLCLGSPEGQGNTHHDTPRHGTTRHDTRHAHTTRTHTHTHTHTHTCLGVERGR